MNGERYFSKEDVWELDRGVTTLGDDEVRLAVSEALSKAPSDVTLRVMHECLFTMPRTAEKGLLIPKYLVEDKSIVALSETLFDEGTAGVTWTILHEIAHFVLDHEWHPPTVDVGERQEREADELARQWLDEFKESQSESGVSLSDQAGLPRSAAESGQDQPRGADDRRDERMSNETEEARIEMKIDFTDLLQKRRKRAESETAESGESVWIEIESTGDPADMYQRFLEKARSEDAEFDTQDLWEWRLENGLLDVTHVRSDRMVRLLDSVWQRLPELDRHILRETLQDITTTAYGPKRDTVLGSASGFLGEVLIDGVGCLEPHDAYIHLDHEGTRRLSDEAASAVVAHELAHIVLRHPCVGYSLAKLGELREKELNQAKDVHEWEADLQVWLWGFTSEMRCLWREIERDIPPWYHQV